MLSERTTFILVISTLKKSGHGDKLPDFLGQKLQFHLDQGTRSKKNFLRCFEAKLIERSVEVRNFYIL